ncbi:MAG: T9SS type A sorting domain-containing protein [Flavobacteriales bacterium]
MKKITPLFLLIISSAISYTLNAQVLNQPASWPNGAWTVGGTYTPLGLINDPTIATNFTFDDDAAGNGSIDAIYAESPVIDLTAAKMAGETWININGDFVYRALGGDILTIDYWNADAASWVTLQTFAGNTTTAADYQGCLNMVAYTTATLNINAFTPTQLSGFKYRINYSDAGGWQWGWCMGSPTIVSSLPPACPDPSDLMATILSPSVINLSWIENGISGTWNIEWDTTGFTPTTGNMIVGTNTNPHSLVGLLPNTAYQFYVQADCGGSGTSGWVGPYSFITPCAAVLTPWIDDVEAHIATTTLTNSNCWSATVSAGFDWDISGSGTTPSSGTGPLVAQSGTKFFFVEASNGTTGDVASLMTPFVDLTALSTPILEFYYHMFGVAMGSLYVDVYNGSTWTTVDSLIGQQQTTQASTWLKRTVDLSAYSGIIQVRFRAIRGSSFEGDISVDNIEVKEAPACPSPTFLTISNLTSTTVDLGWTSAAGLWNIEWDTIGFTPTTGNMIVGTNTNPHSLVGLLPNTAYQFYVQADCGGSGTSTWSGPFTFTTPCVAPIISSFPWVENFDGETVPNLPCGWIVDNVNTDAYAWETSTTSFTSAPNAMRIRWNSVAAMDDWAFTPQFNFTAGQAYKFIFSHSVAGASFPEKLSVMLGTAQNSVSMSTVLFNDTNMTNTAFVIDTIPFTLASTGSYFIGFHGYSDADMFAINIDDVMVIEDFPTGISTSTSNQFNIYPNPNNGLFTLNNVMGEKASVEVLNLQGKVVYKNVITGSNHNIDLTNNAEGLYFVNITSEKGAEVHKIMVQ